MRRAAFRRNVILKNTSLDLLTIRDELVEIEASLNAQTLGSPVSTEALSNKDNKSLLEELKPFPQIPNIRKFEIETGDLDPVFKAFDVQKKLAPRMHFEQFTNHRFVRYYKYQIRRLRTTENHHLY